MEKIRKTEEQWQRELSPERYAALRKGATETPFTGKYYGEHRAGVYVCAACGLELFSSDTKFDSGTGWPSFTEPMNRENVDLVLDTSYGMHRVEVRCKRCGSHLGHVFEDGPKEKGGRRFCINSACLEMKRPSKGVF